MSRINWLAAIAFAALFLVSFLYPDNRELFLNALGLLIVVSGTLGALFLSYPAGNLLAG